MHSYALHYTTVYCTILPYPTPTYLILSYPTLPYPILSYTTLPCPFLHYPALHYTTLHRTYRTITYRWCPEADPRTHPRALHRGGEQESRITNSRRGHRVCWCQRREQLSRSLRWEWYHQRYCTVILLYVLYYYALYLLTIYEWFLLFLQTCLDIFVGIPFIPLITPFSLTLFPFLFNTPKLLLYMDRTWLSCILHYTTLLCSALRVKPTHTWK